jgi:hypothetical protein
MPPFKVTGTYRYFDEHGNLLYWKERLEPGRNGRGKEFRFYHGNREKGRGCDPILYRLPEVIKSKTVIINEGEKQADLLSSWGLVATSLDSGANGKVTDSIIGHMTSKRIAILRDNDEAGVTYALNIANALRGKFESMRIVLLPGLSDKGDICDWAKIPGNDKPALLEIIRNTPEWIPPPEIEVERRERVPHKIDISGTVTEEMVFAAKQFPIDKLLPFVHGATRCICPDHTDKNPSMYHGTKTNRAICGACGANYDTIDAYQIIHNVSFIEAVIRLCY